MPQPFYTPPFLLLGKDGTTALFDDLADIFSYPPLQESRRLRANWSDRTVGLYFDDYVVQSLLPYHPPIRLRKVNWIVRDLFGRPVPEGAIVEATRERPCITSTGRKMDRWEHRLRLSQNAPFRAGPVPCLPRARRSGWCHRRFRHVAIWRSIDFTASVAEEENVTIKGRAHYGAAPPDPWDDYMPSDWKNRTWKRHRRTQWKPKRGD